MTHPMQQAEAWRVAKCDDPAVLKQDAYDL